MNPVVARSERLELRRFHPDEAAQLFALNADPEVLRHTGDAPFAGVDEARRFLAAYDHYRRRGFGRWSLYLARTGEHLGFCGLKHDPVRDEVDLGFRLHRRFWGRGFATEAGRLALAVGFDEYGLDEIVGRARATNTASLMVLDKLGMVPRGSFREEGHEWRRLSITRERFAALRDARPGPGWIHATYCAADKDPAPGLLPALRRYRSRRLDAVAAIARRDGLPLHILSGRFGLLEADTPIPWYDHLLQAGEITARAADVADRLRGLGPAGVIFHARPRTVDPAVAPYVAVMRAAARDAGVPLLEREHLD